MPKKHVEPSAAHAAAVGQIVRLGKRLPKRDKRTAKLGAYIVDPQTKKRMKAGQLPRLKGEVVRSHLVPAGSWGMMQNDRYGDCTCAGAGHAEQIASAVFSNGTDIHTPSDDEVLAAYWATGNPPTPGADDNGRYELDVLNLWRQTGVGGSKAVAFASIDLKQLHGQARYAIDLFGFAYLGVALPLSAQRQTEWKVTRGANAQPGSWGGHAIVAVDYDRYGPTCVTWGRLVKMSWGFFTKYTDEAYAVLLPEWVQTYREGGVLDPQAAVSPQGFALDALLDDLTKIGVKL